MAQAFGSAAHPVDLGPFSRIVEVHWGPKYLALGIAVTVNVEIGQPLENFSIIGPDFVNPFTHHYSAALDTSDASIGSAYVGNSGHWSSIPTGEVVASGLPASSSISLGEWQWTAEDGAGIKQAFHQWHAGSAASGVPSVEAPGGAGTFNQGLDPSIDYKGQKFLAGAPNWTPFFSNVGQWGTGETDGSPVVPLIRDIENQPFSLTGLSVVYKEKTWRPIASLVSGVTEFGAGSLMVLMKKEDVTA